jgi:hypothetical protein
MNTHAWNSVDFAHLAQLKALLFGKLGRAHLQGIAGKGGPPMRTNPSRKLRDLEIGQRVLIKNGVFVGKSGVVLELLEGALENGAEPAVFFVTVRVRAFGGVAIATFNSPTSDEMECLPLLPPHRGLFPDAQ